MSYILDALRRADAERERGSVPGIHAQPVAPSSSGDDPPPKAGPWGWIVAGVSLGLLGALAWQLLQPDAPKATAPAAPAVAQAPSPAIAPRPAPVPAPVPAAPPAAAAATSLPGAAVPAPAAVQRPARPAPPPAQAARKPAAGSQPPAAVQAASSAEPGASAPSAEPRVYAQSELPEEIRRELPALKVGGSMYSETPKDRILILNGQVFHEGDTLAPELLLERIKLKSAVLKYKGYRYAVPY